MNEGNLVMQCLSKISVGGFNLAHVFITVDYNYFTLSFLLPYRPLDVRSWFSQQYQHLEIVVL